MTIPDKDRLDSISEKSRAAFESWFRTVYGRDWREIANDRQDNESITARMAYESGYLTGMLDGWEYP